METKFNSGESNNYEKIVPIEKEILPICPSCKASLKSVPKRKTKCPHCNQYIFLKYSPSNPVKRLVNEDENMLIEEEWEKHNKEQELRQKLSDYNLSIDDFKKLDIDINNDEEVFRFIIIKYLDTVGEFKKLGTLYFEIAKQLYAKVKETLIEFNQLPEEEVENLKIEQYHNYNPFGFVYDNYWEAVSDYIKTLIMEIERIKGYQKAGAESYEISTIFDQNSAVIDERLNKKVLSTGTAIESLTTLLSLNSKEELIKHRPLLLFGEANNSSNFYFPPLYLGCRATTVIHY